MKKMIFNSGQRRTYADDEAPIRCVERTTVSSGSRIPRSTL